MHSFALYAAIIKSINQFNVLILQKMVAGTTALCVLYRPIEQHLYVAWVGDSKAMLVSENRVLQIVTPHKPSTEVS